MTPMSILQGPEYDPETSRENTLNSCMRAGRGARALGLSPETCPLYADPEMALNWLLGYWRKTTERSNEAIG